VVNFDFGEDGPVDPKTLTCCWYRLVMTFEKEKRWLETLLCTELKWYWLDLPLPMAGR
jgi:hypothetical protein